MGHVARGPPAHARDPVESARYTWAGSILAFDQKLNEITDKAGRAEKEIGKTYYCQKTKNRSPEKNEKMIKSKINNL
jgi:hypothetical protein